MIIYSTLTVGDNEVMERLKLLSSPSTLSAGSGALCKRCNAIRFISREEETKHCHCDMTLADVYSAYETGCLQQLSRQYVQLISDARFVFPELC